MGRLVKIQSISDVITNSSSEVYLIAATEKFKEAFKGFENCFDAIFLTEEDIKKYLIEKNIWEIESDLDNVDIIDHNPLADYTLMDTLESIGKTKEEIVEFFFPIYKPLLGYAIWTQEDTYRWDPLINYINDKTRDHDKDTVEFARY